jgi:hydrocephalus-inducing protein
MFDVPRLNFNPLLLNAKSVEKITLLNKDHIPVSFNFSAESVKGEPRYQDSLQVSPMSGVVGPNSSQQVNITFKPKAETNFNYNLICNVKRKSKPILINVKGTGFNLHEHILTDEGLEFNEKESNQLEYGEVYVRMKKIRTLTIQNKGQFNFDFNFSRKNQFEEDTVQIMPDKGTVEAGKTKEVQVIL